MSSVAQVISQQLQHRDVTDEEYRAAAELAIADGLWLLSEDSDGEVFEFSSSWSMNRDTRWSGGTETRLEGPELGSFKLKIYGKTVAIVGTVPPDAEGATFLASIDDRDPFEVRFEGTPGVPYRTWLTITDPMAEDSRFTIFHLSLSKLPPGIGVDFIAVDTVDNALAQTTAPVIVDDDAAMIRYTGSWTEERALGNPFGNSAHASATPGDTLTFKFPGTTVSLFGIFEATGTLSASYTIDDNPPQVLSYTSPTSIPQNMLLFSASNLPTHPTDLHTLTVTLTESTNNTALLIDYLTYAPSFSSLEALRNSKGLRGSGIGPSGSGEGGASKLTPGATAGIVVGIVCAFLAVIAIFCCKGSFRCLCGALRRRRRRKGKKESEGDEKGISTREMKDRLESSTSPYFAFKTPVTASTMSLNLTGSTPDLPRSHSPPPVYLNTVGQREAATPDDVHFITPFDAQASTSEASSSKVRPEKDVKGKGSRGDLKGKRPVRGSGRAVDAYPTRSARAAEKFPASSSATPSASTSKHPGEVGDEKVQVDYGHKITPFDISSPSSSTSPHASDSKAALKAKGGAGESDSRTPEPPFDSLSPNSTNPPSNSLSESQNRDIRSRLPITTGPTTADVRGVEGYPSAREEKLRLDYGHKITPFDISATASPSSPQADSKAALKARDREEEQKMFSPSQSLGTPRNPSPPSGSQPSPHYPSAREEKLRLDYGHKITPFDVSAPTSASTTHPAYPTPHPKAVLKAREAQEELDEAGRITPFEALRETSGSPSSILDSYYTGKGVNDASSVTPFPASAQPSSSSKSAKVNDSVAGPSRQNTHTMTSSGQPSPQRPQSSHHRDASEQLVLSPEDARERRARLQGRLDALLAEIEVEAERGPVEEGKVIEMKRLIREIEGLARAIMMSRKGLGQRGSREDEELPPYEVEVGVAL